MTEVFADRLAQNELYFGGGGPGYYGLDVENVAPDGSRCDLILTFRSGVRYCCIQFGCHLGDIDAPEYWSSLREAMDRHGLGPIPLPILRRVRVVVEEGALVDVGDRVRPSKAIGYEEGPFHPVMGRG